MPTTIHMTNQPRHVRIILHGVPTIILYSIHNICNLVSSARNSRNDIYSVVNLMVTQLQVVQQLIWLTIMLRWTMYHSGIIMDLQLE